MPSKRRKPTVLELSLQDQIAAIDAAKGKFAKACDRAQRAHYIAIDRAKKRRHRELIAVENIYERRQKAVERAWSKVFRRSLDADFAFTRAAHQEDRAASFAEGALLGALWHIRREAPATIPGVNDCLKSMKLACHSRAGAAKRKLTEAEQQVAQRVHPEILAAKKARIKATAEIKRELKGEKLPVENRFRAAVRAANGKLRQAKAEAKWHFQQSADERKQFWAAYARML